jgi:hypothetical protein
MPREQGQCRMTLLAGNYIATLVRRRGRPRGGWYLESGETRLQGDGGTLRQLFAGAMDDIGSQGFRDGRRFAKIREPALAGR